jgi:hypothetical protein
LPQAHLHTGDCHYTVGQRLAQNLEEIASELGQFIQEAYAVVGQQHVARPRHVAAADQSHI